MKQLTFPFGVHFIHDLSITVDTIKENRDDWYCVTVDVSEYEYKMVSEICKDASDRNLSVDYLQEDVDTIGLYLRLVKKIDDYICSDMFMGLGEDELETIMRGYFGIDDEYEDLPEYSETDYRYVMTNITKKMIGAPLEFTKDGEAKKARMVRIK